MYKIEKVDRTCIYNVIDYKFVCINEIDYIEYRIYRDIDIKRIKAEIVMQITSYPDFFNKPD